jgi:hypothetical protein
MCQGKQEEMIDILDEDEIRLFGKVLLRFWQQLVYSESDMAFIELE